MHSTQPEIEPAKPGASHFGQSISRRVLVRMGAGVAALAALWPATALADGDDDRRRGFGPQGRPFTGFPFGPRPFVRPFPQMTTGVGSANGAVTLRLAPVGQINGGTGGDFPANNPGGDGLGAGAVQWAGGNGQVFVALQGAAASQGYDVQFERFNDHGREDLGTVATDGNGNFSGATPSGLGGNGIRIGTFVLIRNGQDQYVAAL